MSFEEKNNDFLFRNDCFSGVMKLSHVLCGLLS